MFMKQSLALDRSCQRVVDAWVGQRAAEGMSVQSIRTGGYCSARTRLPLEMIIALTRETGRLLSAQAPREWRWRDRCVKLADGTGISMPDTAPNQARFPQPRSQAPGVGFPLAGLVGIVCLSTGTVLEAAIGAHASKGQSEQDLFRSLHGTLRAGDVLLGDALYCSYFQIATLQAAGIDVLFEQHGSRSTDFRRGQPLGQRDHRVHRSKPATRPQWMSVAQYRDIPEQILVPEARVNGQVLVSTMHNAQCPCGLQARALGAVRAPLAHWRVQSTGHPQHQDYLGHGGAALFDADDGGERAVGRFVGLQSDPPADGTGGPHGGCAPARTVFQTHGAAVEPLARQC